MSAATPTDRPARSFRAASSPDWLVAGLRSPWTTVALGVLAAALAALIQHWVYPAFSWNRDEPVYLWQVELLRSGQLTAPDGGFPELFHPWLSAWRDGEFFTQYPLGWPTVILLGALIGWPGMAISVAAALAVTGVAAIAMELWRDRLLANVAAAVFIVSPIFAVQSGLYLNYLFTLGLGLWFLALFVGAVRLASPWRAVGAAVAFGWIVATRTYDAVLWGAVAVGYVGLIEWGRWRHHLVTAAWFIGALAPFVLLQLLHNRALTGSMLTFPITEKDPLDTFGFGQRRLMPAFQAEGYGPRLALRSLAKHAFFLPWFLVGSYLAVIVAAVVVWWRRRDHRVWLLIALVAVFPVGYFAFWGTYVSSLTSRLSGPIYFVPLYAPLAILIALGLIGLARRNPRAAVAVTVIMAALTIPVSLGRLGLNRELSRNQQAWAESIDEIDQPAIVVVAAASYLLFLNPYSANAPDGDGDIIYSTYTSPSVLDLLDAHPDRLHLLQRATLPPYLLLPSEDPTAHEVVLDPLQTVSGSSVAITATITPPRPGERVWASIDVGQGPVWRLLTDSATAGERLEFTWTLSTGAGDGPTVDADSGAVSLSDGLRSVEVGASYARLDQPPTASPLVVERFHLRAGPRVDVLTPGAAFRGRDDDVEPYPVWWDEVFTNPELQVEVAPRDRPQG